MNQEMVSFVLRFVREVGEDQQARWRGVIKHVQGDAQENFTQFTEALAFMQAHVNDVIRESFAGAATASATNPLLETARLWGAMMPEMARLLEEAAHSNAAAAQQMQKNAAAALASWGAPTKEEQERTLAALESLTEQLTTLHTRMDELEKRVQKRA